MGPTVPTWFMLAAVLGAAVVAALVIIAIVAVTSGSRNRRVTGQRGSSRHGPGAPYARTGE